MNTTLAILQALESIRESITPADLKGMNDSIGHRNHLPSQISISWFGWGMILLPGKLYLGTLVISKKHSVTLQVATVVLFFTELHKSLYEELRLAPDVYSFSVKF